MEFQNYDHSLFAMPTEIAMQICEAAGSLSCTGLQTPGCFPPTWTDPASLSRFSRTCTRFRDIAQPRLFGFMEVRGKTAALVSCPLLEGLAVHWVTLTSNWCAANFWQALKCRRDMLCELWVDVDDGTLVGISSRSSVADFGKLEVLRVNHVSLLPLLFEHGVRRCTTRTPR